MEFDPSLVGCIISSANRSFELVRRSRECCANLECRLYDDSLVDRYNFFIWEVVRAQAAVTPKHPQTLHYTGDGVFVVSGRIISRRRLFRPEML